MLFTFDNFSNEYYFEDSFPYFEDCVSMASGFTWMFNRGYCRDCGVDLVSIETEEEWFFIDSEIRNRYTVEWYIGLEKMERNWTWVSERPLKIEKTSQAITIEWHLWSGSLIQVNRAYLLIQQGEIPKLLFVRCPKVRQICACLAHNKQRSVCLGPQ